MPFLHRCISVPNRSATPLLGAAIRGDAGEVKTLLVQGDDVNKQDQYGWTPLQVAAAYGHQEVVDSLLASRADPNLPNHHGRSALMYAAAFGHYSIAKALIDRGADVNARSQDPEPISDHAGETALMLAAWSGWDEIIKLLLDSGADVNVVGGPLGGTALHSTLWEGHSGAAIALLQAPGIDLYLTDSRGKTPRQAAIEDGRTEIARLLEEAEANVAQRLHS